MLKTSTAVFLFNLLQDVSILRPIAMMARAEFDYEIVFLISEEFVSRDRQNIWQREIAQIRADLQASAYIYRTTADALAVLQNRTGVIFSGSESNLSAHKQTHDVFRAAPPSFLTVTLQHGFECVGFLQNREHNLAHGRNIAFAANVLCGWCDAAVLTSLAVAERPKLYVTGPSTVLNTPTLTESEPAARMGIVCENVHSVRMRVTGNFGAPFMHTFRQFCEVYGDYGQGVALRPHPAGQYIVNNLVDLPPNVTINNLPIYAAGLHRYKFGISAPSSVVIDMLLAGIPTAVWHDAGGVMDYSNYAGLTDISTLEDWLTFARDAVLRPDALLARQSCFLEGLSMPQHRTDIYARFARLLATRSEGPEIVVHERIRKDAGRRILLLVDRAETMSESRALSGLRETDTVQLLCERDIVPGARPRLPSLGVMRRLENAITDFNPDIIMVVDYTGPHIAAIRRAAGAVEAPLVVCFDHDPFTATDTQAGVDHGDTEASRRITEQVLKQVDLVYCANAEIKQRLRLRGFGAPMIVGDTPIMGRYPIHAGDASVSLKALFKGAEEIVAGKLSEHAWMPQGTVSAWTKTMPGIVSGEAPDNAESLA